MNYEVERIANCELRQRTEAYAIQLIHFYSSLPKTANVQDLGNQILQSGTAVVASYRAACCAQSTADSTASLADCQEELAASNYRFELLAATGSVPGDLLVHLQEECCALLAIFSAIMRGDG